MFSIHSVYYYVTIIMLFILFVTVHSNQFSKYYFTSELTNQILTRIHQLEPENSDKIEIFPHLKIKLTNIQFSIEYNNTTYEDENTKCKLNSSVIYITFDLSFYFLEIDSSNVFSEVNSIIFNRKGLNAIIDLSYLMFVIDPDIGWVSLIKGEYLHKDISFNDVSDYFSFNEIIKIEQQSSIIKNTLESIFDNAIIKLFNEFPRNALHDIFDGTWKRIKIKTYENLVKDNCNDISELHFNYYKYTNIKRDEKEKRLVYNKIFFVIDFTYKNGRRYGNTIIFDAVYILAQQYMMINGSTSPILEDNDCLIYFVSEIIYQGFKEYQQAE